MTKDLNKIEEVAVASALMAENFRLFVSEVIGLDNAGFQNELDNYLSDYTYQQLAFAMPRGFGKSTHASVAYPLWEIAKNHDVRILLVSNTASVAQSFMSEILNHIDRNKKYQLWSQIIDPERKGVRPRMRARQKREERWSNDSIVIDRDDLKLKDPTITATGLFGPLLSKRADIIICDDIVTQETSATEDQRRKIKEWVYYTLMPVLIQKTGRFIYLGNTWHLDDLMSNLLKDPQLQVRRRISSIIHEATNREMWNEWANIHLDESISPAYKKIKAAAFYAEHKADMDHGTEVLWPERFPYADLYLKRIANPYSFARMYQCDPTIRPNQRFSEADIERALQKGKDLILQDAPREEYDADFTTSGLDLAISKEAWGDDTALVSIYRVKYGNGDIKTGDVIIRNIERGQLSPDEVRRMVLLHDAVVEPTGIRVESNGYQEAMSRDLGDHSIPVRSYKTGGEKNDSDIGVNSLAILLSQGKLVLPYSNKDARTRQLVMQLVNEMRSYPEGHTGDSLMALWFAYSEMRDAMGSKITIPGGTYTPLPQGPMTNEEADKEMIAEQEIARSGYDPAVALKLRADAALERVAPRMQTKLDSDLEEGFQRLLAEGKTHMQAFQWAWGQQGRRHAKKYWNGEANRLMR